MESAAGDIFVVMFSFLFYGLCFLVYLVPIILSLVGFVVWILMIINVIQRDESTFSDQNGKLLWILIILLGGYVGAIIYYFIEYRKFNKEESSSASPIKRS